MTDVTLTEDECWGLLAAQEFGRLAFVIDDAVHITPINYAVDRNQHGLRSVLFRTGGHSSKLFAVELGVPVALEIDDIGDDEATSVVVRGFTRHLVGDEAHRAEHLPLRPWVGTDKTEVVEVMPEVVTGRRFPLSRPWLSIRLH